MKIFDENPSFSNVENEIIRKINDDPISFINSDLISYSKKINCSKSAISRLVKILDFNSFVKMKLFVKEKVIYNNLYYDISDKNESPILRINNIKSYNNFSINKTIEDLSLKNLEELIDKIISSNKIHIFGIGSSFLASNELSNNLLKIGFSASSSNDIHNAILFVSNMSENDLLILFTKSGSTKEMRFFMENVDQFKFSILVITTNEEFASKFEYSLIHKDMLKKERIIATSSKICQLIVADILFYEIFFKNEKNREKVEISKKFLEKWKKFA